MSANLARTPIFMRDQAEIAARVLGEELAQDGIELTQERIQEIGLRISREVCAEHAGEMIYVARGIGLIIDERDRELYDFYLKCDKDATRTARKFSLSVKQVYERVRLFEAALQAENQGTLFQESES